MKKLALCLLLVTPSAFSAGIPVVDVDAMAQEFKQHAETIIKWKSQLDEMARHYQQLKAQYDSIRKIKDIDDALNNPTLRGYMPKQVVGAYDDVMRGGYDNLGNRAAAIYKDYKVYDQCGDITDDAQKRNCEALAVKPAQDKATAMDAFDAATQRLNSINQMLGQINQTTTLHDIQTLGARINAEQVIIQNEAMRMQMMAQIAKAQEEMLSQQRRALVVKTAGRPVVEIGPLNIRGWSNQE